VIIDYFNPEGLIYLNMYSIYYGCFLLTLLLAIACNYYINDTNLKEITGIELSPPLHGIISENSGSNETHVTPGTLVIPVTSEAPEKQKETSVF